MPHADQPATAPVRARGWILPAACSAALLIVLTLGPAEPVLGRAAAFAHATLTAAWAPSVYLLSATGWGVVARRWTRGCAHAAALRAGVGLALTLTATHALGVLGVLSPVTAWAWTGAGLVLLAIALRRRPAGPDRAPSSPLRTALLALAAVGPAIMLMAAASPPGALWDSEFGAYDTLAYHLQLPAEWLASGRIAPSAHNVYAFLPGYVEAAYLHAAHLALAPALTPDGLSGFLAPGGQPALAAQFLGVGLTMLAAWFTAAFASTLAGRVGLTDRAPVGVIAGVFVLLTPWTQAVGSMAYNEPGVLALGAGALLAAAAPGLPPARRVTLVAFLLGAAGGCKPTAVPFLAPGAAILMAASAPPRRWIPMFALAAVVGAATLAPWLLRNAVYAGNPVFPHANGLLGHAHWTAEQSARYAAAHAFQGSPADRLATLFLPAAEPGAPAVVRWRGLTNSQWAVTPALAALGLVALLATPACRRTGLALTGAIAAGLGAWLFFTHLQSRFLIPLLPLFAGAIALGAAALPARARPLVALATAVSGAWSVANFAAQRHADPNGLLVLGTGVFTGALSIPGLGDQVPWAGVNETVPPGETLLLVGDATPFYLRRPLLYATTWDAHPLAEAMRRHPGEPRAWSRDLYDAGVRWVLVAPGELARLAASGWTDPLLTPERVAGWCDTLGDPVRAWPDHGRALYRLRSEP